MHDSDAPRPSGDHSDRSGGNGGYFSKGQRSHDDSRPPRSGNPGGFGGNRGHQGQGNRGFGGQGGGRSGGPPRFGGNRFDAPRGGPRPERESRAPRPPKPVIVYKDDSILIINKLAGVPVLRGASPTVCEMVDALTGARRRRMRVAHIIEDQCSGGVLFVSMRDTEDSPRDQTHPETTYLALVEGVFDEEKAQMGETVSAPVSRSTGQGATPSTHIRVVDSGNGLSLVQVRARPDLPGQVREHLAMINHPIVGDHDHKCTRDDLHRLALHAHQIRISHPEDDSMKRYKVPAPASFWIVMGKQPPADAAGVDAQPAEETEQGWDHVAGWYDKLLQDRGSDHHERVILPGVTRLIDPQPGERILDIACGQGIVSEHLVHQADVEVLGVDVSERLIEAANTRSTQRTSYMVHDAQSLETLESEPFDAVVCVMALMNIAKLDNVFRGVAGKLKPGGRFVAIISHPAFRVMGASAWGWTHEERGARPVQFRRIDRYMSEGNTPIVMNPGEVARGAAPITTMTHHRPMSTYVNAGAKSGLLLSGCEEWVSDRVSEPGPRAHAENIARQEIPLFMALRFVKPVS
ncbi:MAG: methyltransferase domain-containing protein [Phycisphaerales bacterium]|nr:methyltransferase domain-containing protein [Phycisphaerales bacterium]